MLPHLWPRQFQERAQGKWAQDSLAVFAHTSHVKIERLDRLARNIVQGFRGGNAAGEVRKLDPIVTTGFFANKGGIILHGLLSLTQSDLGLFLDAANRAFRQVAARVGKCDTARLRRVLQLVCEPFFATIVQPSA